MSGAVPDSGAESREADLIIAVIRDRVILAVIRQDLGNHDT